jgi:hypothetical protein
MNHIPPFKPAWWLRNSHTQTLWPYLFQKKFRFHLERERLELPDGDFIDLCWTDQRSDTIVMIIHGLEGSIDSHYSRRIIPALYKHGWQVVFMHFRGCSGEHNRLARSYHSGDTGDIEFLIDTLQRRFPGTNLFAVGYSLGGNALLKYLGEAPGRQQLKGAVAVSVPFDLAKGAMRLAIGFSRMYQRHLLQRLQGKIIDKFTGKQAPVPLGKISNLNTFMRFDDAVTAPLHGFKDVHDYYSRSSSRQFLKNISVPTLIIHAYDDPFLTPDAIPGADELSGQIRLELSKHGGHVGFVSGNIPFRPVYWLEQRIPEFIRELIDGS